MLGKLLFSTVMLFSIVGFSFGQPWLPEAERQRKEAATEYFAAQRDVNIAKEKESAIDKALQKADVNGRDYDRLARAAAEAGRERKIAEDYRDIWERRAKEIGALVEARSGTTDNSQPVREASLRNTPRETGARETTSTKEPKETKERKEATEKEIADRWREHDERQQRSNDRRP